MAYGIAVTVTQPVEVYDALHAEVAQRTGSSIEGLVFHLGRRAAEGFQVIEVWDSKDAYDRYTNEIVLPIVVEMSGGVPPDADGQVVEEFEVRGLVVPRGDILV